MLMMRSIFRYSFSITARAKLVKVNETNANCFFHSSPSRYKAEVLNGRLLANQILDELQNEVNAKIAAGFRPPHLTAILVGDDPASSTYIKMKTKAALYIGITSHTISLPKSIQEGEIIDRVNKLNSDELVDGILIQLPLPEHLNERQLCNSISPLKDVDGFHFVNMGHFSMNMETLAPCTALGVLELIKHTGIETKGKNAVVCGRSKNVGLPIAMMLHSDNIGETGGLNTSTTICHRFTPPDQLTYFTRAADIIVSAAGVPDLIKPHMVKKGVCIIDVGINKLPDGRIVGDVDFAGMSQKASFITPVPGGVGPMTVAMLMRNTVRACRLNKNLDSSNFGLLPP